jgi:uncharacterized protein YfaS (alpha-2-macroglobulin family)
MVTIQVFSKSSGNAVSGTRVAISVGLNGVSHEYTDSSGEAHFPGISPGNYEVYVNGQTAFNGRLEGRKVIYI